MTRVVVALVFVHLLTATAPARSSDLFDEDASTHDLCMNALVASQLATRPLGRFRVRSSARGLEAVELQERRPDAWLPMMATAFSDHVQDAGELGY